MVRVVDAFAQRRIAVLSAIPRWTPTPALHSSLITEIIGRAEGRDRGGRSAYRPLHRGSMDLQGL